MPGGFFDVDRKTEELVALREAAVSPDLWDDQDRALTVTRRLAEHEATLDRVDDLQRRIDDGVILLDLAAEEDDAATVGEVVADLTAAEAIIAKLPPTAKVDLEDEDSDPDPDARLLAKDRFE